MLHFGANAKATLPSSDVGESLDNALQIESSKSVQDESPQRRA